MPNSCLHSTSLLPECFRLSSRRNRFRTRVIRSTLSVRNLGDCEAACIAARAFSCRSIAFKPSARERNCDLSTFDLRDLGRDDLVGDLGYDLFERRSSSFCNVPQIGGATVDVAVSGGSTLSEFLASRENFRKFSPKVCDWSELSAWNKLFLSTT